MIDRYENDIEHYKNEMKQLQEVINLTESEEIKTFENEKYTNEIRNCCMQLINECNVSLKKIPHVLNTVVNTLTRIIPQNNTIEIVLKLVNT